MNKKYSDKEIAQQFEDYFKDQFGVDCLYSGNPLNKPLLHKLKSAHTVILLNAELIRKEIDWKTISGKQFDVINTALDKIENALRHINHK